MPNNYQTIGKRERRKDSIGKASGTALYTADIKLENTLWASIFRSSQHAARIIKIGYIRSGGYARSSQGDYC